ncbi:MAG: energy-coupling factor transporter transmembrane protein EcfT [Elusimicrobiota bacterium]|jgi:biotin transport system permease protein/energy-coupling factor transport system permease protein|nr:energy-coupling factor transporter transmembrane protein EcfT [Elusimicrobiota bacterium]
MKIEIKNPKNLKPCMGGLQTRPPLRIAAFSYQKGNTFIHKTPAWIKILFILPASIIAMQLPLFAIIAAILIAFALYFICRIPFKLQMADLKAARYYFFFLYALGVWTKLLDNGMIFSNGILIPGKEMFIYLSRLVLIMQIAGIIFHTTTSIEIKEAIDLIESKIRSFLRKLPFSKKFISANNVFAISISLFFNFIPAIFEIWQKCAKSFKARGGKGFFKKAAILLPILISLSLQYARNKDMSYKARSI